MFIFKKTCKFKESGYNQVPTMFSNIFELLHRSEKVVYHKTKIKLKSSWNLQNSNGIFTVASRTYSPGVCFRSQVFYPHRIVKSNRHTYTGCAKKNARKMSGSISFIQKNISTEAFMRSFQYLLSFIATKNGSQK